MRQSLYLHPLHPCGEACASVRHSSPTTYGPQRGRSSLQDPWSHACQSFDCVPCTEGGWVVDDLYG